MRRIRGVFVCAFAVLLVAGLWPVAPVFANPPDGQKGHGRGRGKDEVRGNGRAVERVEVRDEWRDRDRCRLVVTSYYDRRGLPPGLAKKRSLPPGLQKQLRERGHLPPGLERHLVVLPVELDRSLPPLPPHYARRMCGDDLLVIDVRTNFVVSIMAGVFIRR